MRGRLVAAALCVLLAAAASAQEESDQLYLVGFEAPLGSISQAGQNETAIYLLWGTLEGELPADLVEFELLRDGSPVGTFPAAGSLGDLEIFGLYAGAENQRRLLELVRWLGEEDPDAPFSPANFPGVLRERVLEVPPRAAFLARVDFGVAQALYRGHRDTGLANASYEYELRGHFAGGEDVRMGLVTVVRDGLPDAAPAAAELEQVSMRRCDAPEAGKDHHVVALDWQHAGATLAERNAHGLAIAGYDLYRTVENADDVPVRDLRAEAAAVAHELTGEVELDGLEKVNDQPLVVSGAVDTESRYEGFNPQFASFFETREELMEAGIAPGDRRAYYLVARDVSGNYGETTGLLVQVPDLRAPVAPWQVRGFPRDVDDVYTLTWPHVQARNYFERHRVGRTYCNLETARFDGYLEFVPEGSDCEDRIPLRAELDVQDYLVYRFEDAGLASRFVDGDGDGFHDPDERPSVDDPGTACDPTLPDPNLSPLDNYLVGTVPAASAAPAPSGHLALEFVDPVPGQNDGQTFWYRVASRDAEGNVSQLAGPVPGIVHARTIPQRDDVFGGLFFGRRVCEHAFTIGQDRAPFAGVDLTETGSPHTLRITCDPDFNEATPVVEIPFETMPDGTRRAELSDPRCAEINDPVAGCGGKSTRVEFLDRRRQPLTGATYLSPDGLQCPNFQIQLIDLCPIGFEFEIADGEVVPEDEGPVLDPGPGPNCTNVYRHIDGRRLLLDTLCPGDDPLVLDDLPDLGSDAICLSVASYDHNAQASMQEYLPCFRRPGRPSPPTPVSLAFTPGSDEGAASLLQAELPAEGALIEWQRLGDPDTRRTRYVPRPPGPDRNVPQTLALELTPEPAGDEWQEEWCFRGLSIGGYLGGGLETGVSEWSVEACGVRQPAAAEAPPQLGWPWIDPPGEGEPIEARYFSGGDQLPVLMLSGELDTPQCGLFLPECDPDVAAEECVGEPGEPPTELSVTSCNLCELIARSFDRPPPFVVYRQWRAGPMLPASDFVQVSPLVEPFCEAGLVSQLDDPFLSIVNLPGEGHRLLFADRTPYREDIEVRYQVVYHDPDGEIRESRTSNWIGL